MLPAAIMNVVKEEPGGAVGLSYRRYVKSALLPAVRRVADLLRNHAATIEVSDGRTSMSLVHTLYPLLIVPAACKLHVAVGGVANGEVPKQARDGPE